MHATGASHDTAEALCLAVRSCSGRPCDACITYNEDKLGLQESCMVRRLFLVVVTCLVVLPMVSVPVRYHPDTKS
jgi:hypothetical protein